MSVYEHSGSRSTQSIHGSHSTTERSPQPRDKNNTEPTP